MTTRDISEQVKEIYWMDISPETLNNITNRILVLVTKWQSKPIEKIYSFIFIDAINYKVKKYKQSSN